jgi:hypothetical protein
VPWKLPEREAELLQLAKSYPYEAPRDSYLFAQGTTRPLTDHDHDRRLFDGRVPVIAHGSNRAPAQLARKYGAGAEIPVSLGWLAEHDVVYSAHMTRYGAIASTLHHAPGVRARVAITWLDTNQLDRMHETEGSETYSFGHLRRIALHLEDGSGARLTEAGVYQGNKGCLADDRGPVGLAAVTAEGRPHKALHQEAALDLVRARHRPGMTLDQMILEAVGDRERRQALVQDMAAHALPVAAPHFELET